MREFKLYQFKMLFDNNKFKLTTDCHGRQAMGKVFVIHCFQVIGDDYW